MKHPQRERSKTALAEAAAHVSKTVSDLQTIGQRRNTLPIALSVPLDTADAFWS